MITNLMNANLTITFGLDPCPVFVGGLMDARYLGLVMLMCVYLIPTFVFEFSLTSHYSLDLIPENKSYICEF